VSAVNPRLIDTASAVNSGAIHLLRALRAVDRESGLTPARLSALSVLVFSGPCTLGRLARVEDVAGPTMTRIVDGLCALELVRREPHPDSGRAVRIVATADGERVMRAAAQRRRQAIMAGLHALPELDQARIEATAPAFASLAIEVAKAIAQTRRTPSPGAVNALPSRNK
jgi:DNA-binding MarR family transcriptional regulator